MAAADAIAGEAAAGHAARAAARPGVAAAAGRDEGVRGAGGRDARHAGAIAVVGVLAGLVVVGGADGQLVTLSGTTVGVGGALGRVALVVGLDGRAARRGRRGRAGHLGVDRAPAGRAGRGARRADRVRGAGRDPGARLAAALPADHRLDVPAPTRCATRCRSTGSSRARCARCCYLALGGGLTVLPDAAPRRLTRHRAGWPHGRTARRRRHHRRAGRPARLDTATATRSCAPRSCRRSPPRSGWSTGWPSIAEERDHHPDIDIRWRTLTFRCSTHSRAGITELDVALAAAISAEVQDAGGE